MIPKPAFLISMAVMFLAVFMGGVSVGWKFIGYPRGFDAGQKAFEVQYKALNTVALDTMRGKQQCVGQVEKVNVEVDRQKEENRKILIDDRVATKEAMARMEVAATIAVESTKKTQIQITEARNEMVKIKDACVSAGVPSAYFDVLNRALATASAPE